MPSLYYAVLLLASLLPMAAAHGRLSSPPPRGSEKAAYLVDDLNSPNRRGLCRGEPEGQITSVRAGQTLRLGLTITAPHVGPCKVYLLDTSLGNSRQIADKMNCAAPGGPGFWDIQLPADVSGRKVLRWTWEGQHVSPSEPYEQCVDLAFGDTPYTGDGSADRAGDRQDKGRPGRVHAQAAPAPDSSAPAPADEYDGSAPAPTYSAASAPDTPAYDGADDAADEYASPADEDDASSRPTPDYDSQSDEGQPDASYPAGSTSEGACAAGSYECTNGAGFNQCANGQWVSMQCAAGTTCQPQGGAIVCAMA